MINVFVSRPNWIPGPFKKGLDVFLTRLVDLGLNPRTLGATDYPTKSPLDEVIKLMGECRGAVILGYPQIELFTGLVKGVAVDAVPMLIPTEWNHIEAGLAYARGLPLLVIHHPGISRGIFDHGALNSFLFRKDLSVQGWSVGEDISGAIRSWKNEVLSFSPTPEPVRNEKVAAIEKNKDVTWTIEGVGRKIRDIRPLPNYRESTECRIAEITDFYIRVKLLSSDEYVTLPFQDIVVSHDDKKHRPKLEVRAN